jgi:ABC-2 type transport system ATP-binding protein
MNNPCPFSMRHAVKKDGATAIELRQLSKAYKGARAPALNGIDLTVREGGFFGILGPNGAGKTTLMSVLGGLLKPSSGEVRINGKELSSHRKEVKRVLGMVPQEPAIYPTLTARENLEYFGRMQGLSGKHLRSRVEACLEIAEISADADQRVEHFSGGFKRRLNLVIGLIHEPRILILDEPTVAIDPHSRALIHQRLRELHAAGISILISTHYMEEAEQLCQEIAIMHHGRVLVQGSVSDLLAMQRNETIQIQLKAEAPETLADTIRQIPGLQNAVVSGRCVMVTAQHPDAVAVPLMQVIHECGAGIRSMGFGASSLEQVFLSLTGSHSAREKRTEP